MKKCPRCEINWIQNDADELCEICRQELSLAPTQIHIPKPNVYFNEWFTFKRGNYVYDNKSGFKAYNEKGEHVGVVFMTNDPRTPAYRHCELHCFPQYYDRYGEWHRITSYGNRIAWAALCNYLENHAEYKCFID